MQLPDSADEIIKQLGLTSHPEGGWYRQTWRAEKGPSGRHKGTAILFLLKSGEASHWHRVDADEMWIWQGGDPLELSISPDDDGPAQTQIMGDRLNGAASLQCLVPKGHWQAARPAPSVKQGAGYCLVTCTVVPGFEFAGFELAPPGWAPGKANLDKSSIA